MSSDKLDLGLKNELIQTAATPEPDPPKNEDMPYEESIQFQVEQDLMDMDAPMAAIGIRERAQEGRFKYGTFLLPDNGRSAITDAMQEAADLCVYLKQAIEEGHKGAGMIYPQCLRNYNYLYAQYLAEKPQS